MLLELRGLSTVLLDIFFLWKYGENNNKIFARDTNSD